MKRADFDGGLPLSMLIALECIIEDSPVEVREKFIREYKEEDPKNGNNIWNSEGIWDIQNYNIFHLNHVEGLFFCQPSPNVSYFTKDT